MNIEELEKHAEENISEKTGVEFLDKRLDAMRNGVNMIPKYYSFFYWLTRTYTPKIVVELGSWQGTSAAHFAAGNEGTIVITVDHHTDPGDQMNRVKTLEAADKYKNMVYCQGWTCDQLYEEEKDSHSLKGENAFPKVMKALDGRKIDVLFIDSWHRYDQALKDWNAYKPLLKKNALVICDDIDPGNKGGGIEGMDRFWEEIKHKKFLNHTLHNGVPMGFFIYDV